jgi:hypothetical protein
VSVVVDARRLVDALSILQDDSDEQRKEPGGSHGLHLIVVVEERASSKKTAPREIQSVRKGAVALMIRSIKAMVVGRLSQARALVGRTSLNLTPINTSYLSLSLSLSLSVVLSLTLRAAKEQERERDCSCQAASLLCACRSSRKSEPAAWRSEKVTPRGTVMLYSCLDIRDL